MSPNNPAPEWGSFLFVLKLARQIALKIGKLPELLGSLEHEPHWKMIRD